MPEADNLPTSSRFSRLSLRWKLILAFIIFGTLVTGLLSTVLYSMIRTQLRADFHQRLQDIVGVGALSVAAERHQRLQLPEQEGNPDYLAVKKTLQHIQARAADIHFVYTMRADAKGRIVFVVDAETNPDDIAHLGEIYTDASPFLAEHFLQIDHPVVEKEFYTDRWGTWLTGYAPILDRNGNRIAVLGVDIAAQRIVTYEKKLLLVFAVIFLGSILLSSLLGVFLGNRFSKPILNLKQRAEGIGQGDFTTRVQVHSQDEIGVLAQTFNIMIDRLKQLVDALQTEITSRKAAEKKFRSIFDHALEGIFQSTLDGRLVTANPEFARLLGYASAKEAVSSLTDISHQLYVNPERRQELVKRLQTESRVTDFRINMRRKDGSTVWTQISARVVTETDGPPMIEGLIKDISEELAKAAAEREQQAAEAANQAKSEFLANMSHEIRTPMNAVMGLAHLMLKTDLTEKQADYMTKIMRAAQSLLRVINDILDFSKIEAGKLTMEIIDFDLEQVMNSLADVLSLKAEEKGLEMLFRLADDLPHALKGDPYRLEQVLTNLVNNAIKFTETGNILVSIQNAGKADALGDDSVRLRFAVIDTGIGIGPDQMERLFQSFSQADDSITRQYGGTGLGLVICQRLVEMMGGTIEVESSPGHGSTFSFTALFERQPQAQAKRFQYPGDLKGMKVLVVDDNSTAREIICNILSSFTFRAHQAPSGPEAIEDLIKTQASDDPYKLVIMDWKMPGMDGVQASKTIREHPGLADIPSILMLTAYSRDEIRRQAVDAGVEGFLVKPVNPSLLFDTIMSVFARDVDDTTVQTSAGPMDIKGLDAVRGARVLLVEDNDVNRQVATELLESEGFYVDAAPNGRKAVDLLVSVRAEALYDVVLMDIQMPEMDGYTATREIRKLESAIRNQELGIRDKESGTAQKPPIPNSQLPVPSPMPIIAMTAHALENERKKCLAAGMNDHVSKPIDPQKLFTALAKWITPGQRQVNQPRRPAAESGSLLDLIAYLPGFDVAAGLQRVAGNQGLYQNLLFQFAGKHADAAQAVRQSLADGDPEAARSRVHAVKGMAGNLGALSLHEAAGLLETALKAQPLQNREDLHQVFQQALTTAVDLITRLQTALAQQTQDNAQDDADTPAADNAQITAAVQTLNDLIQNDYGAALDQAAALKEMLSSDAPLADRLLAHLEAFEESEALACLHELAESHGIDIEVKHDAT